MQDGADSALAAFERERPRLLRLAHRMLGSVSDAEDVLQTAWLRWSGADRSEVRAPAAWLTRTVSRLALDALGSAHARRTTYVGPWLPEPVVADDDSAIEDSLTTALMLVLERLSPLERAAFLLHDVFGTGFGEVARILERDEAACRQLAARARQHVRAARPRFTVPREQGDALAEAFFAASRSGDVAALQRMLAAEVTAYTDGGGVRSSARRPIIGRDRVIRFFAGLARKPRGGGASLLRCGRIDGLPGFVTREADGLLQTTALECGPDGIIAVYIVRNPEKLRHLAAADWAAARPAEATRHPS
ncbi:MAG TPA: sigma-70 family RNA polymerase sigma factor [Acetobacteraceae bacterium]|nr:sigma-70 family RNA polymerase sigma factor [Acetobacteraceae bacterium]